MNRESNLQVDVVVIGAGVVGLATAFELSRNGRDVLVLERYAAGSGATGAAGGMLAPVSEADLEPPELIRFARDSLSRYPAFLESVERVSGETCRYRGEGTLWVAVNRDDLSELEHLRSLLERKGLEVHALDSEAVLEREPHLSGRVLGGLLAAQDHQIDPRALCRGLERALRATGGAIACGMEVSRVEVEVGGEVRVEGQGPSGGPFEVRGRQGVLAAGAWSGRGLHQSSSAIGLRPVKGQLVRLRGRPLLKHVVRTPDVYLIPRTNGELLLGATTEEMGFDSTPTAGAAMDLLRHGWQALPGIYDLELVEVCVGLRSAVDDHLPVIGRAADGLFVAYGHHRNGILLAPATAHYLARWMAEGAAPAELRAFRPDRWESPALDTSGLRATPTRHRGGRHDQPVNPRD
jgi:glycine oxidase